MDTVVDKVYPLISNESALNAEILLNLVKSISESLSAEQRDSTLSVLQAIVAKWQKETKGVVPFELEATFELVVKSVVDGSLKVPAVSTRCLEQIGWLFCRRVAAVVPGVVDDISAAAVAASVAASVAVASAATASASASAAVDAVASDAVSVSSALDAVIEDISVVVAAAAATTETVQEPVVKEAVREQVQHVASLSQRRTLNRISMKSDRRE